MRRGVYEEKGEAMKFYEAVAIIKASPDAIWSILTDAAGYITWDSGVERVDGGSHRERRSR